MHAIIDGDLVEGKLLDNVLSNRGESFILFEDDDEADKKAADVWREKDPEDLILVVGAEEIARLWSMGRTLEDYIDENVSADDEFGGSEISLDITPMDEYLKDEYPSLSDWIDELGNDFSIIEVEDDDEEAEDKNYCVELLMGWQELIDELGFTPTIAYKN